MMILMMMVIKNEQIAGTITILIVVRINLALQAFLDCFVKYLSSNVMSNDHK